MNKTVITEKCCRCGERLRWMATVFGGGWVWESGSDDWCHPEVVMDVFRDCAPALLRVTDEKPGGRRFSVDMANAAWHKRRWKCLHVWSERLGAR